MKVTTLGGGHGQSTLLSALSSLDLDLSAIVSVADDGGCSGELRQELAMPPPGDIRRCVLAAAGEDALARRYGLRVLMEGKRRSLGNLELARRYQRSGSLQLATDEFARDLLCSVRVIPASESPADLAIFDRDLGIVRGESHIGRIDPSPVVAMVESTAGANPVAIDAIESADLVILGPGSFFTSVLSAVTSPGIAAALVRSRARKLLVVNLGDEGRQSREFRGPFDYARVLSDHVTICTRGESIVVDTLSNLVDGHSRAIHDAVGGVHYRYRLVRAPHSSCHSAPVLGQALAEIIDAYRSALSRAA